MVHSEYQGYDNQYSRYEIEHRMIYEESEHVQLLVDPTAVDVGHRNHEQHRKSCDP
ncbi:hypothetical protein D3C71_2220470 [compost metagenome]